MENIKRQTGDGRVFVTPSYLRKTLLLAVEALEETDSEPTERAISAANELDDIVYKLLSAESFGRLNEYCLHATGPEIVAAELAAFLNATHPYDGNE